MKLCLAWRDYIPWDQNSLSKIIELMVELVRDWKDKKDVTAWGK